MKNKVITKIISPDGEDRLRIKFAVNKGKVINIMVQYETMINNVWHEIVRYDCSHGFLHRDVIYPNKKQEKQPLNIENMNDALQYAEQDIKDRWRWYKERYKKRMRRHEKR